MLITTFRRSFVSIIFLLREGELRAFFSRIRFFKKKITLKKSSYIKKIINIIILKSIVFDVMLIQIYKILDTRFIFFK